MKFLIQILIKYKICNIEQLAIIKGFKYQHLYFKKAANNKMLN